MQKRMVVKEIKVLTSAKYNHLSFILSIYFLEFELNIAVVMLVRLSFGQYTRE